MLRFILSALLTLLVIPFLSAQQLAFPGAEGFGAYAQGGRGGKVIYVTNLDDSGPGSLREAVEQQGPRVVLFAVAGIIDLKTRLTIQNPYITIAGQSAPGDGICIRGETLQIEADHVIVRYLRVRLGDGKHGQGSLQGKDAISLSKGHNIIVDHCSGSWSLDEILSASTYVHNLDSITVQWCYITEALNPDGHGFGSLIRGTGGSSYSYLYNLYAHNRSRNPRPGNYNVNNYVKDPLGLLLDFRNNVIYNWEGGFAGYNADTISVTRLNYINNYLIPGANSRNNGVAYSTGSAYNKAYFAGNYYDASQPEDQWSLVHFNTSWTKNQVEAYKQTTAFDSGPINARSTVDSYEHILLSGGASLPKRDQVDSRVASDVRNKTGLIIQSQEEVGGWPKYEAGQPAKDTDQDGIPDDWERSHKLNKKKPDSNKIAASGYTMLEEYLNGL